MTNVSRTILCSLVVALGLAAPGAFAQSAKPAANDAYKLGERLPAGKAQPAAQYKQIAWEELIPKSWDPAKALKGLDLSKLEDGDPRAMEAMQKLRDAWDNAPAEPAMHGKKVRIPGFIVPLESQKGQVTEFLLVPYFGACIHSPPPPANQTIHVMPTKPVKNAQMMDAVWVSGTLETAISTSVFGNSGYKLSADVVVPYVK